MKAIEQYFLAVQFIMLYKRVLFRPWIKSLSLTIQMKATEQYFSVIQFIMLYKVALTFSLDKILDCQTVGFFSLLARKGAKR